jgi:hypothetical protein
MSLAKENGFMHTRQSREMHVSKLTVKLNAPSYYPFKITPRRFAIEHLNDGATKTPDINSKIIAYIFR